MAGTIRATNNVTPTAGIGLELLFAGSTGYLSSIDRGGGNVYKPLQIYGSVVSIIPTVVTVLGNQNAASTSTAYDANLINGTLTFWVDETNNLLVFRYR